MTVDEIAALIEPKAIPRALALLDDLHAAIGGCVLLFGPAATAQFMEEYRAELLEQVRAGERVGRCLAALESGGAAAPATSERGLVGHRSASESGGESEQA